MVDLDVNMFEVVQVLKDALIIDVAIQGVAVGPVVGVSSAVAVVVESGALVQAVDGSVSGSVSDGNHKVEFKTLAVALGNEEPVW